MKRLSNHQFNVIIYDKYFQDFQSPIYKGKNLSKKALKSILEEIGEKYD